MMSSSGAADGTKQMKWCRECYSLETNPNGANVALALYWLQGCAKNADQPVNQSSPESAETWLHPRVEVSVRIEFMFGGVPFFICVVCFYVCFLVSIRQPLCLSINSEQCIGKWTSIATRLSSNRLDGGVYFFLLHHRYTVVILFERFHSGTNQSCTFCRSCHPWLVRCRPG